MAVVDVPKLLSTRSPEEMKLWADKVYQFLRRFDGLTVWSVGVFYAGTMATSQTTPRFIVPEEADQFYLTHLKGTFQSGTLTGNSTVEVSLIRGGSVTLLGTITLTSTAIAETVYTFPLASAQQVFEDDLIKWVCTAGGGHSDVTAKICGRQAA